MEEEKYAIQVEWYDESASLNRTFTLFYYTRDQTVEMVNFYNFLIGSNHF